MGDLPRTLNREQIPDMHEKGVIGFKYFWGYGIHQETYQLLYNVDDADESIIHRLMTARCIK
ncbi:hypothetical protein JCM19037_3949 [Geomicrobium sp. JCM 19037]|nr:hypothetical protein JCM19037_3949 [Geomicrobium sp. JCM 19037]